MKSTFKLTLAIALCLGSAQALALQLGQIRVKSALDEPLVAEIPIQLDSLNEAQGLNVGLASDADFARAGLSRAGLEHLRFSVVNDTTGHKIVLVTSEQPIGDPYLDFLVQVDTAKGKQLREYTVLLDLVIAASAPETEIASAPAAVPQNAAPVEAPAPAEPAPAAAPPSTIFSAPVQQPTPAPNPVRAAPPSPTPPPPAPSPRPVAHVPSAAAPPPARSGEYRVNKGDTLYHIADQTRPDTRVSLDQMMLALQKTNPDAFYRDNINALKSGAILRIPTRDAVTAASLAAAHAQVRHQNEDWSGAAARKATTVVENNAAPAAATTPGTTAPSLAKSANASDRLALVPPAQSGGAAASRPGEKGGTGNAEVAGLKQQLANAKESLTSVKQENGDLQSRVKDLEDISNKNQKLLGMKDAEIAELQRKLADAQQQAAKPVTLAGNAAPIAAASSATTPKPAASVGANAPPASTSTAVKTNVAAVPEASSAPVTTPAKTPTTNPPAHAAPQPAVRNEPIGEIPWYRQPLAWVIGGVVILALILLGLLRRRPRPLLEPEIDKPSLADHFGVSPYPLAARDDDELHSPEYADDQPEHESDDESVAPNAAEHPAENEYGFAFDELPPEESLAAPGMAAAQPPVAGADDITREHRMPGFGNRREEPAYQHESLVADHDNDATREHAVPAFSDDPVDTKLDLARAYLDMGDPAGARAMLEEVINEGSQMQKDEARKLLDGVA